MAEEFAKASLRSTATAWGTRYEITYGTNAVWVRLAAYHYQWSFLSAGDVWNGYKGGLP